MGGGTFKNDKHDIQSNRILVDFDIGTTAICRCISVFWLFSRDFRFFQLNMSQDKQTKENGNVSIEKDEWKSKMDYVYRIDSDVILYDNKDNIKRRKKHDRD